jgi:VWFA-related protein
LLLLLDFAQDEVRVSSRPYVPVLRVDTRPVEVAAVVRDGHGKPVAGLTKDDFRISDDGKATLIDHFVIENAPGDALNDRKSASIPDAPKAGTTAPPPRYLALFIDDVNATDGSLAAGLKHTQAAAEKFVKGALGADIRVGVFTTSGATKLDFTSDESKLLDAIGAIRAHVLMHEDGLTGCPRITPYLAYRIFYDRDRSALNAVVYDSGKRNCPVTRGTAFTQAEETWRKVKEITAETLNSVGAVVDHLGKMQGRRELILASSGFLAVSMQEEKDRIIDRAIRAGVVINALDSKGLYVEAPPGSRPEDAVGYPTGGAAAARGAQNWNTFETTEVPFRLDTLNEPMANLAEATGGVFYHNNNDLNAGFRQLGGEPQVTYRLGFRPEGVAADGSYHKLKVAVKGYTVQARAGYFAPSGESLQAKIDREILAEDTVAGFPVGIAVQQAKGALAVIVSVDISKLHFTKQGNRSVQKIAFTTALFDAQGKLAAAKEGTMDLSLTEATFKRLSASGVNAKITFQVPVGRYRLRQVAEDGDGKIACSSHAIEVR